MKTLKQLLTNQSIRKHPVPLFSKLKEFKLNRANPSKINGVPMVNSDCESEDESFLLIQDIKERLQRYKRQKAQEVAHRHSATQQSIQKIVEKLKNQFQYEALCLIDQRYKRSSENYLKSPKELGQTLPSSCDKGAHVQTPGFDLSLSSFRPQQRSGKVEQFTLGQRGKDSSTQSKKELQDSDSLVSEFRVNNRQTASRKIKNKIMNPQKCN